jgi:prevent-host-death family protein
MKPSEGIKPISYLKTHASEVIRDISEHRRTMVITQNGEAKVILQDIKVYEEIQESLALLKILALANTSREKKQFKSLDTSFNDIRKQITDIKTGK